MYAEICVLDIDACSTVLYVLDVLYVGENLYVGHRDGPLHKIKPDVCRSDIETDHSISQTCAGCAHGICLTMMYMSHIRNRIVD